MTLFDTKGRITIDNIVVDDGTIVIPSTSITGDGSILFEFIDHLIPIYSLSNSLHDKAIQNDIINYNISIECTNSQDPGNELNTTVPIPSGFTLMEWDSNEGDYDPVTETWTLVLDGMEAYLNLKVSCDTLGTQSQTVTLNNTGDNITNECLISSVDSDGVLYYTDVIVDDPEVLANLQDGEKYTVSAYSYVNDTTLSGIHDGIYNNRLSVINADVIDNLCNANIATACSRLHNTTGFSSSNSTISASTDWTYGSHDRSLKVITNNSANYEGYSFAIGYKPTVEVGKIYTGRVVFYGVSGTVRVYIRARDSSSTISSSYETVTLDGTTKTSTLSITIPTGADRIDLSILTYPQQGITFYVGEHIIVEGTEIPVGKMELGTGDILVGSEVEIFGTRVDTEGEYHKVLSVFTYDQTSDLKIRLYGQYQSVSTTCDDRWAGIGLYQNYQTEYDEPTNLLSSPDALLGDSSSSDITLISNDVSAEYQFNLAIPTLTNPLSFFTGAELKINSFGETNSGIEASIITPNLNSNTKSNYIATTGTITFGDMMDLWGLSSTDIMGETIQLSLKFSNTSLSEETLSYNNLTLTLYYVEDSTGGSQGFTAKNIHSLNYQLFLLDVDIPEGPDRDIGTVNFPLSDGETIVNYSLKSKDIKITFAVWGDTLEETSQKLRNINKWLTNSRNALSIPEPYDLIFDFRPDMTYKVILGEPIDTNIKYTAVECDATFTVESGVALTTETKITGPVGSNDGIIKVKPDINILCDGSTSITLTDTISNQTMTINTTITDGTLITINCTDRTITDESDNDYTTDVDVESIWFNLISDYNFNCEGGVVQSVSFKEGY